MVTNNGTTVMPDANNMTVTTRLLSCDNSILDLHRIGQDLRKLYQNNLSNWTSSIFSNVSIINYNCVSGVENYFEQLLTFTQSVSIRIQILFASIYSDYINVNDYQLNGFRIHRQTYFDLSSITINNRAISNACSSADAAHDPLCLTNSTHPVCTTSSNRWNFTCSPLEMNNTQLETTVITSPLNTWQLALVCSLSVVFILLVISLSGYFYRRYTRSKQIALSRLNLYDDLNLMQKTGIPQGHAFQRATTVVQPKRSNNTAISWIHEDTATHDARTNTKPLELYHQGRFIDHTKVYHPNFPSNTSRNSIAPGYVPTNGSNKRLFKTIPTIIVSRTMSGESMNQVESIIDGLPEDKLDESDTFSFDQSVLNDSRTPLTEQFTNLSCADENLNDEDAWMSILDVVNAELAILNEQDRIRVSM